MNDEIAPTPQALEEALALSEIGGHTHGFSIFRDARLFQSNFPAVFHVAYCPSRGDLVLNPCATILMT
ncbi:MAG: hypothetical protein V1792_03315 [Pseudomonadota bacterium]